MLFGGYSSCQGCGCVPCKGCTATCTEPHTGAAFETVFTNYFEGVEVGNPSDGYLTASGDNDTSDPYDGMDGSGPWMQQVGGAFNDGGSYGGGTRFPCTYRFSFWRSVRGLGLGSIGTSTALTENVITLTVSAGAIVYPDGTVITPESGTVALSSVPLVTGGAGAVDPHTGEGSVSFALQCQNVETTFSVTARIRWNVQKRQHTLYGIVRECYEEGTPCATVCSGSPSNNTVYLTISNWSGPSPDSGTMNGTYALARSPYVCDTFGTNFEGACRFPDGGTQGQALLNPSSTNQYVISRLPYGGECFWVKLVIPVTGAWTPVVCGSGTVKSGTKSAGTGGTTSIYTPNFVEVSGSPYTNSFDWEITA